MSRNINKSNWTHPVAPSAKIQSTYGQTPFLFHGQNMMVAAEAAVERGIFGQISLRVASRLAAIEACCNAGSKMSAPKLHSRSAVLCKTADNSAEKCGHRFSGLMSELRKHADPAQCIANWEMKMAEDDLAGKLSGLIEEIKTVMERRKERIEALRNEINEIEDQNAELEKTISNLLSAF